MKLKVTLELTKELLQDVKDIAKCRTIEQCLELALDSWVISHKLAVLESVMRKKKKRKKAYSINSN